MDSPTLLIDMDGVLVNMPPKWLEKYNKETGEDMQVSQITKHNFREFCQQPEVLDIVLHRSDFFYDMEPMPGAVEYFQKLMDLGYDLVVVTQPPRNSDFAVRDKRRWMLKHFPSFDLTNMVFCHRKELVGGNLLFDDSPKQLNNWKAAHPEDMAVAMSWKYNEGVPVDFRFQKDVGWELFFNFVTQKFPLK